jgi:lysophospholipase L1-like esterase
MRALRLIPHAIGVIVVATLLLMFKEWAYVATYRLYLDHRVDAPIDSTARQRFDLDESGVVPRIVARDERMSFRAAVGQDATLKAGVKPSADGSYEIRLRQSGTDTLVARGMLTGPATIAADIPTGNGVVDIVSHGELTWSDLRLQRSLRLAPELWLLAVVLIAHCVWRSVQMRTAISTRPPPVRMLWPATIVVLASVSVAVLVLEAALRAAGHRLPSGITALRHDLGEPTEDVRWTSSMRYGQRLRADIATVENEWRDGDIIRMGFVPAAMSEGRLHRYPLHTDREGFRNAATRARIDVAALGDSFTDALTMAADASWPVQLEKRLGLAVQNYGTSGFGPQQERLVLEDYGLTHHPRLVVLAFFAGNDIRDAERFEEFEHGDGALTRQSQGWKIKDIFIRAETWYVTTALQAARGAASPGVAAQTPDGQEVGDAGSHREPADRSPQFDRGVFTIPVHDKVLRFALMPPYLNLLRFSAQDLAARRGWTLALENIRRMQHASRAAGARFVVMFIPFKSQVYLPLLLRSFGRERLAQALQFFLPDDPTAPDVGRFARNRLAQNGLMQEFCTREGIPFLDLTPALQQRVERGEAMYFQDDSHFNEAGEAMAAATLADFLQAQGLLAVASAR